jgi:Tfp pilus assembly protein PilF
MVHIEFRDAKPENVREAMRKVQSGVEEAQKGRLAKALQHFKDALSLMPENVDARRNMAKVYLEQGQPAKAKQHLQECLQIEPKDAWSCVMMGNIYARNEGNLDIAAFYFDKCLELNPEDAMVMTNYAALMMENSNFQQAEILFKKAISIQDIPNAYYGLALLYQMAGQNAAALKVLETFFERAVSMEGVDGSPICEESKKLYREISSALKVPNQGH